jgi:hypothetical protein
MTTVFLAQIASRQAMTHFMIHLFLFFFFWGIAPQRRAFADFKNLEREFARQVRADPDRLPFC